MEFLFLYMKQIITYITEKLRINKDSKYEYSIKPNDKILFVHIQKIRVKKGGSSIDEIKVDYDIYTCNKITDRTFGFKTDWGHEQEERYIINDKGYIELNAYHNEIAICFSAKEGISFLKDTLKNPVNSKLLLKYCDNEDTWLNDYVIIFNNWEEGINKTIKKLEENI